MTRKALAKTLLLMLPATAPAAEWVQVASYARERLEFDRSSVVRQGSFALAWDRSTYEPGAVPMAAGDVDFRVARTLMRYDCDLRTVVPVVRSFSQSDGAEVLRQNVEGAELPQPVVPDSPRDRMLELACRSGKPVAERGGGRPPAVADASPAETPRPRPKKRPVVAGVKPAEPRAPESKAPESKAAEAKPVDGKAADPKAPEARTAAAAPTPAASPARAETPPAPARPPAQASAAADKSAHDPKAHGAPSAPGADKSHAPADKVAQAVQPHGEGKASEAHWSYEGATGAKQWHKLSPDYALCAEGRRQSPIDIREGVRTDYVPVEFKYKPSPLRIVNNGHTIQVAWEPGSTLVLGDTTYELVQFHFHKPAEEKVNGRTYDMVTHLVHRSREGKLAVVAVLMIAGDENGFIRTLWNNLPLDVGMEEVRTALKIDVAQLLPKIRGYYLYMGSLTTPPCTEGVKWVVMRTPVQVSRTQIQTFSRLYDMNARPIQAANGRFVKEVL